MSKQNYNTYFRNKVVWITGASKGIGFSLANQLLKLGAKVAITSRNEQELASACQRLGSNNVTAFPGDITSSATNKEIVDRILEVHDQIDIVILNAGTAEYVDIEDFDHRLFERQINTNYLSIVYGVEACLPHLKNRSGTHLVAMSSAVAFAGLPRGEAYGASKAAVRNMFQALRIHLTKHPLNVHYVCPGFVKTPLTEKNDFPMPLLISSDKAAEKIIKGIYKKKGEIHFPGLFTNIYKLLSCLPNGIYSKLMTPTLRQSS